MNQVRRNNHWAIIPAAGSGKRHGGDIPKQYLALAERTVIEQTLTVFMQCSMIDHIVVVIDREDRYWHQLAIADSSRISTVFGGEERCHSVCNALHSLKARASADDWVLVHDAARPCLESSDLDTLIATLQDHAVGGLLATPVRDTLKRADANHAVIETIPRQDLWQALTPQMFRYEILLTALSKNIAAGVLPTDESAAVEAYGLQPQLIAGDASNIKITWPGDIKLAALYLQLKAKKNL